jgi:hypothetical protein
MEVNMSPKPVYVAICLLIAVPAEAGGLLGDLTYGAGVNRELGEAQKNVGAAIRAPNSSVQQSPVQQGPSSSKTCVTPQGLCGISDPALNGSACFCNIDTKQVFGRVQ